MELKSQVCNPCSGDSKAIAQEDYGRFMQQLPGWSIANREGIPRVEKTYEFTNYTQCLAFVQQVGIEAEKNDHHPEIILSWGKVHISWWTHTLGGLHLNDFILAARCNDLAESFYVNY